MFNSLGETELLQIFDLEFEKLRKRYEESGYELRVTEELKKEIVRKCEPKYGARSLTRLLTEYIDQPVCKALLEDEAEGKYKIMADVKEVKFE